MKRGLIGVVLVALSLNLLATNYYVSSINGSDSNDGKSINTAWKTLSKVNSSMSSFVAGDSILLQRGSIFYESLNINKSGSAGKDIVFGAYGSGNKPIISGATEVSGWTAYNSKIWQASFSNIPDSVTNLFVNDNVQILGRDPNSGYYQTTSASGNTFKCSKLTFPTTDYYKGAKLAVRTVAYIVNTYNITATATDGTITSTRSPAYVDNGFIIMNHINTLDEEGEWCYDRSAGKIYLYTSTDPNTKKVEIDYNRYGLTINKQNYVTVENIEFTKEKFIAVRILTCNYITFKNNTISYTGGNGARVSDSRYITFDGNTITNTANTGIEWLTCRDGVIKNNTIRKSSLIPGKGFANWEQNCAIILFRSSYGDTKGGSRNQVLNNRIDSSGYCGIHFLWNDSLLIKNNYITNSMLTLDDGGAIYNVRDSDEPEETENKIIDNIIDYSYGNNEGTSDGYHPYWDNHAGEGIYLDNLACNILVQGNTVINAAKGIYLHTAKNITMRDNVLYNNWTSNFYVKEEDAGGSTNTKFNSNYSFNNMHSSTDGYYTYFMKLDGSSYNSTNSSDSNYLSSPYYNGRMISFNGASPSGDYTLSSWQTASKQDAHSKSEALAYDKTKVTESEFVKVVYNPSLNTNTISLPGTYVSLDGVSYNGSVTLGPYKGIILLKDYRSFLDASTTPSGTTSLCAGTSATYTTTGTTQATSYTWQVNPSSAGTVTSNGKSADIAWSSSYSGTANVFFTVTGASGYSGTSPSLSVTVNGKPAKPNKPSGTSTLTQGAQTITYTTSSVSGATKYNWSISPSSAATLTGTTTSVSSVWSASFTGSASLTVNAENTCGTSSASDALTITVNTAGVALPAPTGPSTACNTTSSSFSTAGVTQATTYTWKISPSTAGTITGSNKNATVAWSSSYTGTASITYDASGSGMTTTTSPALSVTVNGVPAKPSKPSGTSTLSQGAQTITYTTGSVSGATKYNWSISPSSAATLTGTTTSVSSAWSASFTGSASLSVNAENTCGTSATSDALAITVNAASVVLPAPTGPSTACNTTSSTYTTAGVTQATTYAWSVSPSSAATVTGNGKSASVAWSSSYTGTATISYTASGSGMTTSTSPSFSVTVSGVPAKPNKPTGSSNITQGQQTLAYNTSSVSGATKYNWSISPSTAGNFAGSTNSVNFTWASSFNGSASMTVSAENSCGTSAASDALAITVNAPNVNLPAPTGQTTVCNGTSLNYSTTGATEATSYTWKLVPASAGTITGNGKTATVVWSSTYSGSASISYEASGANMTNGTSPILTVTVNGVPAKPNAPSGISSLLQGSQKLTYSTNAVSNATGYTWSIDPSSAGVFAGTSNSVSFNWSLAFSGKASMIVKAENSCGSSAWSDPLPITVSTLVFDVPIPSGETAPCQGSTSNYTTEGVSQDVAYSWKISPASAGTITSNGKSATIVWDQSFAGIASVYYDISGSGVTGTSQILDVTVQSMPATPSKPNGDASLKQGSGAMTYSTLTLGQALSYTWSVSPENSGTVSGSGASVKFVPNKDYVGTVQLTVQSSNSCGVSFKSEALTIVISQSGVTAIPSFITPDGDGHDDIWNVSFLTDHPNAEVRIYNMAGQLVKFFKGYELGWDGYTNGELAAMGTYIYVIDLKDGSTPIKGKLAVIR